MNSGKKTTHRMAAIPAALLALGITGEYLLRDTQVPGDFVRDHGGYLQLDFQIDRYWITSARGDYVARISGPAPEHSPLAGRQLRGSLSAGYMPTHFSKIRVQLDIGDRPVHLLAIAGGRAAAEGAQNVEHQFAEVSDLETQPVQSQGRSL